MLRNTNLKIVVLIVVVGVIVVAIVEVADVVMARRYRAAVVAMIGHVVQIGEFVVLVVSVVRHGADRLCTRLYCAGLVISTT